MDMKMAKVITMKTWTNCNGESLVMVTTVDPRATIDIAARNLGLTMLNIASRKESAVMPLPLALDYARQQRQALGITKVVYFMDNQAA